jgi:hypothetical protein
MKSKNLITLSFIVLSYLGMSQNISTGEVVSVVPIGGLSYSFILETGTEYYYKTSPHQEGTFVQGQVVELLFNQVSNHPNSIQVNAPSLTEPLFCQQIINNVELSNLRTEIDYRRHVSFNAEYNVLVFETWEDVKAVELLLEEQVRNYPYNRGNENAIALTIQSIKENGWNMSENSNGKKVSLKKFKELLDDSHPLSTNVLVDLLELDEEVGLNPSFLRDVFVSNLPLSSILEERIIQSTIAPGIKNQILEENDYYLDFPNYAFQDFLAVFPGYTSLYEKLNDEELQNLESGMDPSDPDFDDDLVFLPFERLIMNDKYEVWIEGALYKLYKECLALALQNNSVSEAFNSLSVLNNDGSPMMPALEEPITGIPTSEMEQYVPLGYIVYNPEAYDPLGSIDDDPYYNTVLQEYNLVDGCAKSNFTYSLYSGEELTVDFSNQTNFFNLLYPEEDFIQYWNFGDGTGSFQKNPSHKFPDYGTYTVSLATFLTDCGCWHVHQTAISTHPIPSKEGNPDCPFEGISIDIGWNGNPLSVLVTATPDLDEAVSPNTSIVNYNFAFYTLAGTLVHQQSTTVANWIFFDFANKGEYYVEVTATWDGGCISTSAQHLITLHGPPPAECCDKHHKKSETVETTFGDNSYKLKYKDLARGTFGTSSWRKIEGYQKLYRKKPNQIFWKKYNAWHIMTIHGFYYDRTQTDCDEGHIYGPLSVYDCYQTNFQRWVGSGSFPNRFGIDKNGISVTHTVYLHGQMIPDTSTDHCCDCYNVWGHKLFDFTIQLGKEKNCD